MELSELLQDGTKLFAKSEFGPANADWPALSFSSQGIARRFQSEYVRGRDFVIYVGTSNPEDTPDAEHRQRLVSVVDVEPRAIVQTKSIVSPISWERAQTKYPGRWDVSLRLARAWTVERFPRAHDALPITYLKFRSPGTRGHPIPVEGQDFPRLAGLTLAPVDLELTSRAEAVLNLNVDDGALRRELSRLANLIQADVSRSLSERGGVYPPRAAANYSDIFLQLKAAWAAQDGACGLCGGKIPLEPKNKLLKMSRDRVVSAEKNYYAPNLHLTHYGCNLAKSDATMEEWHEFRHMLGIIPPHI